MGAKQRLREKDLRHWRLIEDFLQALEPIAARHPAHSSFADPRRLLDLESYLALFLFGLFNPVVGTMRQLCASTELAKVRRTVGCEKVSLGSFSAAQHLIDPDLLKHLFESLAERLPRDPGHADPRLRALELIAQDGSLWSALPRMAWAEYGAGRGGAAKGVRLHLRFHLLKNGPEDALVTEGKGSEIAAAREMLLPGQITVGDRFYGHAYRLFAQIDRARAFFVFRLQDSAVIHQEERLPVSPAESATGVASDCWARLGATEELRSMRVRVVQIQREGREPLRLATNLSPAEFPAELIGLIYRRRWQIELYFRWIKCLLGMRHFFAESREGASIQIYLGLIASVLLQLHTGARPNKRVMEFLQMYFLGWASAEELPGLIAKYSAKKTIR